ncbi:alpha-mannosidase 2-like [Amphibalanus amphitrite]|uniref:alpha-mannosidase 2-like n=1 Tax=Amphibalanus amphitrite TaxID=1232801 RepID=UPI001C90800A|nr:alpha-mannosidase 2-like [Amphibalanus amphitrite]
MSLCRWLSRWQLFFRTRRRTLRLLLLTSTAAFSLLVLALPDTSERRSTAAGAGDSSDQQESYTCLRVTRNTPDLDLTEVLPTLNFTAPWTKKKTFWNAEMEKRFQKTRVKPPFPLKIMVVPHSHNDPGWGWTVVDYYRSRTRHVLDSIVLMMPQQPNMRFMWTEVTFLQLWWEDATEQQKNTFKELVRSGRLEITTGGWVMTDEAVTRMYPMLDQLTEGHRWLKHHLNATVKTGWAVDPFGHGSTMPYLLRQADIKQTVILRTPYVWKEYLAARQGGDFIWQQQWDKDGSSSMLTHHHPYFMYTTSAACGPFGESSKMCFNFDFARDWANPVAWYRQFTHVTDANVKERAELLVDAAGRTASLFPHNVALMMLGADFQFQHEFEWREQYTNYTKLMTYINSHPELDAEIQFATPAEYFSVVRARSRRRRRLPTLVGDFHVYSDVFQAKPKYWSGYYTTLPHWKRAARQLESHLRATDILYSWAWSQHREAHSAANSAFYHSYNRLVMSRQDVALFNHHDAITGTSATHVMRDFIERLEISDTDLSRGSLMMMISLLLELGLYSKVLTLFDQYSPLEYGIGLPPQLTEFKIPTGESRRILLFNPLAQPRTELMKLRVMQPNIAIADDTGKPLKVHFQPDGIWFTAYFLAPLDPLAVHAFQVTKAQSPQPAVVERTNRDLEDFFHIRNDRFVVTFNKTGFTWSVLDKRSGRELPFVVTFEAFSTVKGESGLYLFATVDEAPPKTMPCRNRRWTVREDGAHSEATVECDRISLTVRLLKTNTPQGQTLQLETTTSLTAEDTETDVFMRLQTGVESCAPRGCGFYSDANDYQMVWRPYVTDAGVPGNVYPVTTQASVQDNRRRVTLLMDHSRGIGVLDEGEFTVMLDRRSNFDDNRGIGQGNQANRPARSTFWVTFEDLPEAPVKDELFASSPMTAALARELNHPPRAYMSRVASNDPRLREPLRLVGGALPCGWELVTLRQLQDRSRYAYPGRKIQMTLLRRRLDCRLWDERDGLQCRHSDTAGVDFSEFLGLESIHETGLTGGSKTSSGPGPRGLRDVRLKPDQIRTFELGYTRKGVDSVEVDTDEEEIALVKKLNDVSEETNVR